MKNSDLIKEFESSQIVLDISEYPGIDLVANEVGAWLDDNTELESHDGYKLSTYMLQNMSHWTYMFRPPKVDFVTCAGSGYFYEGNGKHWGFTPKFIPLYEFWEMIKNCEKVSESDFDAVFS